MPIRFNTKICNYFNKEWFGKGIIYVNDLFMNETFMSLEDLRSVKRVKCKILEYESIKKKFHPLDIYLKNNGNTDLSYPLC